MGYLIFCQQAKVVLWGGLISGIVHLKVATNHSMWLLEVRHLLHIQWQWHPWAPPVSLKPLNKVQSGIIILHNNTEKCYDLHKCKCHPRNVHHMVYSVSNGNTRIIAFKTVWFKIHQFLNYSV